MVVFVVVNIVIGTIELGLVFMLINGGMLVVFDKL